MLVKCIFVQIPPARVVIEVTRPNFFSQHVHQQLSQGGRFNCRSEFGTNIKSMGLSV